MKMCLGPCVLPVERDHYISLLRDAVALLEGNISELKQELEMKMQAAARAERYESAAQLRDQIRAIEQITQQQVAILNTTHDADIIGFVTRDQNRSYNVTHVRNRALLGGDSYAVELSAGTLDEELTSFLLQYYANRPAPPRLLLRDPSGLSPELSQVFSADSDRTVHIEKARAGEESDLVEIAERNAEHHLESRQGIRSQQKVALQMLQESLSLPRWPHRIECIDISNIQGTAIVASDVCFIDGKPAKDFYRRYEIKTVVGSADDFASMREVVERRLERAIRDHDLPDLLIIDGGRPQVQAVQQIIDRYPDLDIPFVGLAKSRLNKGPRNDSLPLAASKERLVLPDQDLPIELDEASPVYRLVTRIRDEAHRFAITYHRKKRQRLASSSILDEIPGVGPTLKKRLLVEFGSIKALRESSLDRLQSIKGVSEKLALNLHAILKEKMGKNTEDTEKEADPRT